MPATARPPTSKASTTACVRGSPADSWSKSVRSARSCGWKSSRAGTKWREGASARWLLAEVHALVEEAEAWVKAEGPGADLAEAALVRCRDALAGGADGGRVRAGEEAAMR